MSLRHFYACLTSDVTAHITVQRSLLVNTHLRYVDYQLPVSLITKPCGIVCDPKQGFDLT